MKYDTIRSERRLSPVLYKHRNPAINKDKDEENNSSMFYQAEVVVTPVRASHRVHSSGRSPQLWNGSVSTLSDCLSRLMISNKKEDREPVSPSSKPLPPSTRRLLREAPEAANPDLGRSSSNMVQPAKPEKPITVLRSQRIQQQQKKNNSRVFYC